MLAKCIILAMALSGCFAYPSSAQTTKVICGEAPTATIFSCFDYPLLVSTDIARNCSKSNDPPACFYKEMGWMDGETISKKKISNFFDKYAAQKPIWAAAVSDLKTACLTEDLPPQTNRLDCPACDITHCVTTSVVRKADPSLWKTSEKCTYARAFVDTCPICPHGCFGIVVPIGSCNACYTSPRSTQ